MRTVSTSLGPVAVEERGPAEGPVALLWPSLFTDHTMWHAQVASLSKAGWRTLSLDPPSHGASPGPDRLFTMDECATAAVEVLDAIGVREPVVAFGTSWGGFVAPRIAMRAPSRVRALVLFATSADAPRPSQRLKASALAALFPFGFADRFVDGVNLSHLLSRETLRSRPEVGRAIAQGYRSWDRRRLLLAVRSVLLRRTSIVDALSEVRVPALVVSGGEDGLLPSALGRRIAERIPAARFVEVAEAAHLIPLERPDIANRLIAEFLRDMPALASPGIANRGTGRAA